ncbi:hypothetical protein BDZ94DRAFT_662561 [Collybia nuda]|uniref:Uncharacterized protein n=1 Tax=Collybia nuda TaxID=64659 RepID=A0A9P5XTM7_9AGAR|nr:hypothetical protein BDZ94DRAFT_662561 [Collybia nuda]
MKGQHTGEAIGKDLARVVEKFGFSNKLGWMVGDNVTVNDVAIRVLCKILDPSQQALVPHEVRGRCINHTTHLSAAHFVKALGIPKLLKSKQRLHATGAMESSDDESDDEDDFDINISMDIDADDYETEALTITDYDAGDVVGKLMAFINQLRGSSEGTRDFLKTCCIRNGSKPLELKLWVRTRWGSLSDCFQVAIAQQDAIDEFCVLADNTRTLPKLRKGKTWLNYKLTSEEWDIVTLAYNCLKVPASIHSTLSAEKVPTATKVYPHLDYHQSKP